MAQIRAVMCVILIYILFCSIVLHTGWFRTEEDGIVKKTDKVAPNNNTMSHNHTIHVTFVTGRQEHYYVNYIHSIHLETIFF